MLLPFRRLDNRGSETREPFIEVGIRKIIHFSFTRFVDRDPDRGFRPLPPLPQWNFDRSSIFFGHELEGCEVSCGTVSDGTNVENTTFPVSGELDAFLPFGLLPEPSRHLIQVDSPLGGDAALAREIQSKVSGRHGAATT